MAGDAPARAREAKTANERGAQTPTASKNAPTAEAALTLEPASPPAYLAGIPLLDLQRKAGNAAVAALVSRRPAAGPKRSATAPQASALIAAQFPHLVSILKPQDVAQIQQVLDTRSKVAEIDRQIDQVEKYTEEGAQKRAPVEQQRDRLAEYLTPRYTTVVVPTQLLLAGDVLMSDADRDAAKRGEDRTVQSDMAYRDMLYTELISFPIILEMNEGLNPSPLFTLLWGPDPKDRLPRGGMPNSGGQITWHDLMKIDEFSGNWILAMQGEKARLELAMLDEAAKAPPGNVMWPPVEEKKLGERTGALGAHGSVKVGHELGTMRGYVNDQVGQVEMAAVMDEKKGAKVVFERMGVLHPFMLEPADALNSTRDLVTYANDGYGYIRDYECEVPEPWKVLTTDGIELTRMKSANPEASGWGTPLKAEAQTRFDQFVAGAFMGDFIQDQTGADMFGQLLIGMIPVVGEIAVARDVAAGLHKIYMTGGKEGKFQTAVNLLVLFLPVIGPLFRSALRGGEKTAAKVATRAMEEEAPKLSKGMGELLERDLPKAEKLFPEARAAGKAAEAASADTRALLEAALKGDRQAAKGFAEAAGRALDESGGDVASLVRSQGGKWAEVVAALKQAGKEGETVGKQMAEWRLANVRQGLEEALTRNAEVVGSAMGRDLKPPVLEATGSPKWTSDLDMSLKGPHAGAQKMWAEKWLAKKFGADFGELLNVTIFTESSRLHAFEGISGLGAREVAGIEGRMVKQSELNVLAKMLHEGSAAEDVMKYAKQMHPDLAKDAAPEASQLWKDVLERKAFIDKLASDKLMQRQLQLEIDALAGRLEKATDAADRAAIAEEMADKQMKLNTILHDAYATPGAGFKQITAREAAGDLGARFSQVGTMSARMRYMAVIGELPMVEGILRDAEKGLSPQTAKGLAKYADRLVITAGQLGGTDAAKLGSRAIEVRGLYEDVEYLLIQKADPVTLATKGKPELARALEGTQKVLEDLIATSKAAEEAASKAEKPFAHDTAEALEEHLRKIIHIGGKLLEPPEGGKGHGSAD